MKYLPLVLAGLWRKPARTVFTFLSIVVAFILFGMLSAVDAGFAHLLQVARQDRLFADSRYGTPLPYAYASKIAAVPGVKMVAPRGGMGGYWRTRANLTGVVMADERFFGVRPELTITPQQLAAYKASRTAVVIGTGVAKRFGWKVGDRVPMTTSTAQMNGSRVWTFDVAAIVDDTNSPGQSMFMVGSYKYLDEARATGKGTVDRFLLLIDNPSRATQVCRAIDNMFASSGAPTRCGSEKEQAESGLRAIGDVSFFTHAVISAVLFMLLFLTGNTMMQSVRQRIPEFAVLKTLGYSNSGVLALVFAESALLCVLAGTAGLSLVKGVFPKLQDALPQVASLLRLPWSALVTGFGLSLIVALAAGLFPALRVSRMNVVDALAGR